MTRTTITLPGKRGSVNVEVEESDKIELDGVCYLIGYRALYGMTTGHSNVSWGAENTEPADKPWRVISSEAAP